MDKVTDHFVQNKLKQLSVPEEETSRLIRPPSKEELLQEMDKRWEMDKKTRRELYRRKEEKRESTRESVREKYGLSSGKSLSLYDSTSIDRDEQVPDEELKTLTEKIMSFCSLI